MTVTKIALAMVVTASATFAASTAQAGTRDHLDLVALRIQGLALELHNEIPVHYRHTSSYLSMRRATAQLYALAAHTHSVAHFGSIHHLENDLRQMDYYFHQLERLIDHVDRASSFGIGGHKRGCTAHVFALLREIEGEICHLRDHVESLTCNRRHNQVVPVLPVAPVLLHQGGHGVHHHGFRGGRRGGGITFGGNGWRVRIGG